MSGGFFVLMSAEVSYDWALLLVRLGIGLAMLPWGLKKIATYRTFDAQHQPPKLFAVGPLSAKTGFFCVMLIEFLTPIFLILGFCIDVYAIELVDSGRTGLE